MDAHAPYNPPPPFDSAFSDSKPLMPLKEFYALSEDVNQLKRSLPPGVRSDLVAKYDGAIRHVDYQVGALLDQLREWAMSFKRYSGSPAKLNREEIERLKALGYVQ